MNTSRIHHFTADISKIELPRKFPHLYNQTPHRLCRMAGEELQTWLHTQHEWNELLGVNGEPSAVGKMFGVLVVKDRNNTLGYLAGFSGAINGCNQHPYFVPPIYDLLNPDDFFKQGEQQLNQLNQQISTLEQSEEWSKNEKQLLQAQKELESLQSHWRSQLKASKEERKLLRTAAQESLTGDALHVRLEELNRASQLEKISQKRELATCRLNIEKRKAEKENWQQPLIQLKEKRKELSAQIQADIFSRFRLLNHRKEVKDVLQIFHEQGYDYPPAGTGDCAAPKLLQHAFQQDFTPIALAEFWWGAPPKSEVRHHGQYHPPCRNKCEPILKHMMQGIEQEEDFMTLANCKVEKLQVIYEDKWLIAINKPAGFLSVPGKKQSDNSVLQQLQKMYPEATGPILVHRLDMATSGILLAAKDAETHKELQQQFIKRQSKKCYIALLDGEPTDDQGTIDLPLRVDLDNRPQQLVCFEHGKSARTLWEVLERKNGQTRVLFRPITGRTHQLRVHAAHALGLHCPIVGDALYGTAANRLYLHAQSLEITHPHTHEQMIFHLDADF